MKSSLFLFTAGLWLTGICSTIAADRHPSQFPFDVLTNAAQIRNLTTAETVKRLPVELTGVMMDTATTDPKWRAIILADQTASIYMVALPDSLGKNILTPFSRGDLLEITGVTGPGQFAPIMVAKAARKLGTAPIPAARPATYQQLITGALDAQWVEITGIVRQCIDSAPGSSTKRVVIAVDGGLVQAVFTRHEGPIQVDAEVRVQAVCFYQFNQRRQVLSPILQVPRDVPVIVTKPAPANPYDIPARAPTSLLTFSPKNLHAYAHRVHVHGVVTCSQFQSGSFIWIRDGASGLRLQTDQQNDLSPGDQIDALGFPAFGFNTPEIEDVVFRKSGSTAPPVPIMLTNFDRAFEHEDDLVAAEGTLTQIQPFLDGITFTLNKGGQLFKAALKVFSAHQTYPGWELGDHVRVTGICTLVHDDTQPAAGIWQPKSFQILLRSPADISIIQRPPWTLRHITMLLGMATVILVLMISAVVMLSRRRLRQQEHHRQMAEAEFAAILSERNRLAREIHDTLAQGLTVTSIQLRLARKHLNGASEIVGGHLDAALSLVSDSLEEARSSIWNMRSHILETAGLVGALKGILGQMVNDTEISAGFEVIGKSRALAPVIENNILRIGQEAITNAVKHSGALHAKVVLEFGDKQFCLRVTDDGCGFDPRNPPASEGGFGLIGMRERAAELKGKMEIISAAGQGTEIILCVPLPASK